MRPCALWWQASNAGKPSFRITLVLRAILLAPEYLVYWSAALQKCTVLAALEPDVASLLITRKPVGKVSR